MLLVCVEWNKSPLLYIYKLEQLYKHLPVVVDYIHYTCCTPRWRLKVAQDYYTYKIKSM